MRKTRNSKTKKVKMQNSSYERTGLSGKCQSIIYLNSSPVEKKIISLINPLSGFQHFINNYLR